MLQKRTRNQWSFSLWVQHEWHSRLFSQLIQSWQKWIFKFNLLTSRDTYNKRKKVPSCGSWPDARAQLVRLRTLVLNRYWSLASGRHPLEFFCFVFLAVVKFVKREAWAQECLITITPKVSRLWENKIICSHQADSSLCLNTSFSLKKSRKYQRQFSLSVNASLDLVYYSISRQLLHPLCNFYMEFWTLWATSKSGAPTEGHRQMSTQAPKVASQWYLLQAHI